VKRREPARVEGVDVEFDAVIPDQVPGQLGDPAMLVEGSKVDACRRIRFGVVRGYHGYDPVGCGEF